MMGNNMRLKRRDPYTTGDSILVITQYKTIAHIKNYDDIGKRSIWFNDSLIGKIKGRGFDGLRGMQRTDLVFYSDGLLKIGDDTVRMARGKEYYIILYSSFGYRRIIQHKLLTDKEHFSHRGLIQDNAS